MKLLIAGLLSCLFTMSFSRSAQFEPVTQVTNALDVKKGEVVLLIGTPYDSEILESL